MLHKRKGGLVGSIQVHKRLDIYIGECWEWPMMKDSKGYGVLSFLGSNKKAHRLIFELFNGTVADGMVLDLLCSNRSCVSPFHLQPVTNKENVLRGEGVTAVNARKTVCSKGHPLSGNNLYVYPDGRRDCRRCRKDAQVRWHNKLSK